MINTNIIILWCAVHQNVLYDSLPCHVVLHGGFQIILTNTLELRESVSSHEELLGGCGSTKQVMISLPILLSCSVH